MVGGELAVEIRVLAKHGKGVREIAREVGVSRNTVRRYLRDPEAARYRPRPPRPGKLEPFESFIAERAASAAPKVESLSRLRGGELTTGSGSGQPNSLSRLRGGEPADRSGRPPPSSLSRLRGGER